MDALFLLHHTLVELGCALFFIWGALQFRRRLQFGSSMSARHPLMLYLAAELLPLCLTAATLPPLIMGEHFRASLAPRLVYEVSAGLQCNESSFAHFVGLFFSVSELKQVTTSFGHFLFPVLHQCVSGELNVACRSFPCNALCLVKSSVFSVSL